MRHTTAPDDSVFRPPLGTVQRRIVVLEGFSGPEGMRVEEIARLANRPGGPSTRDVLDTLRRRGVAEELPGDRYRLAAGYQRQAAISAERSTAPPARRASNA